MFRQGRRPKLTGDPHVDLARLPIKPGILDGFVYHYSEEDRDAAAIDRFYSDVVCRIRGLG